MEKKKKFQRARTYAKRVEIMERKRLNLFLWYDCSHR